MKTILVPVDLLTEPTAVLNYTATLAQSMGAKIKFHNVVYDPALEVPLYAFDANALQDEVLANMKADAEMHGHALIEKLQQQFPDVECEFFTSRGRPYVAIIHAIKKEKPDLVIMGSEYPTGIRKLLVGSMALDVLNEAAVPVLVIPEENLPPLGNILYATNFEGDDKANLLKLLEWCGNLSSRIYVVHFALENDDNKEGILEELRNQFLQESNAGKIFFDTVAADDLMDALQDYAERKNIALFSTTTHHRNMITKIFNPSQTAKIIRSLRQPVLAFQH